MMSEPMVQSPPHSATDVQQVQVDLGGMEGLIGRIKAAPVCVDESLKKESMSAEQLQKLAFPFEATKDPLCSSFVEFHKIPQPTESSVVSSASSTASRESAYLSDFDASGSKVVLTPLRLERKQSEQINLKVTTQKTSRNGRLTQRWHTDPQSQRVYRMVTGCVPIVEGGKILFVSANRKSEWILPKGGWENDELLEESAIRETFEEAGVLGVIGPRLEEIEYETRKSKKRRLELQEAHKMAKIARDSLSVSPDPKASVEIPVTSTGDVIGGSEHAAEASIHVSNEVIARIRGQAKPSDETCSVASDTSSGYSHVRMTLFPLYVSEVRANWPECGRFRKAVDIDEAISMCESRPEFQAALKQVKERGLHFPQKDCTEVQPSAER